MNGAKADPCVKTIKNPNNRKIKNIGKSQYFFLYFTNSQNSLKNSNIKIDFSFFRFHFFYQPKKSSY